MSKRIYVGNLPFSSTEDGIRDLFSQFGNVVSVRLVTDRDSGRSRGFGFVEMETGGDEAIQKLDKQEFEGRNLTVNEARPREPRRTSSAMRW